MGRGVHVRVYALSTRPVSWAGTLLFAPTFRRNFESSCRVLVCLLDRVRQLDGMPAERIDEVESGHEHGLHA